MENTTKLMKIYKTSMPATKFVGKVYHEEDKRDGTFSSLWGKWMDEDLFTPIEALIEKPDFIEDGDAYYGMCRINDDGTFEYWIGMIVPEQAEVPEGYASFAIPACDAVVNWVYGKEPDVFFRDCMKDMEAQGYQWDKTPSGELLMTERYACPRYTEPDKDGNVILDMVYFTNYRAEQP